MLRGEFVIEESPDRIHTLMMLLTLRGWRDVGSSDVVKILQLKRLYNYKFKGSIMSWKIISTYV